MDKSHILQRAWAAGVFDARITMPKNGYVVRFESTDEPLMRRFVETVGVGQINPREKKQCVNPVWVFNTINMDDTRELLLMFSPFLSAQRLKQSAQLIARIERSKKWQEENPEKAVSSVISPAQNAAAETTQPSTTADGRTATA